MKHIFSPYLAASLFVAAGALASSHASAQILNIDFLAYRGTEGVPNNTSDPSGFAGGGNVYNGLVANDSLESDNITVAGTNLVDSHGAPTSVSFTISPVGADDNTIGVFNGSDLFTNSANNLVLSAPFTISGLGAATTANLIFFTTNNYGINVPLLTFNGGGAATPTAVITNYEYEFDNVSVTGGILTGTIGTPSSATPLIFSGLAIETVPEPSAAQLMFFGIVFLGAFGARTYFRGNRKDERSA